MCRQGASSLARSKNIKLIITGGLMLVNRGQQAICKEHNILTIPERIWEYFLYPSKIVIKFP